MFSWFKKKRDSFQEIRQKLINTEGQRMGKTIDLMLQARAQASGDVVRYFLVTTGWGGNVRTEVWSIAAPDSLASKFAWLQQLSGGKLALLNALETTKEIAHEVELNNNALFRSSL